MNRSDFLRIFGLTGLALPFLRPGTEPAPRAPGKSWAPILDGRVPEDHTRPGSGHPYLIRFGDFPFGADDISSEQEHSAWGPAEASLHLQVRGPEAGRIWEAFHRDEELSRPQPLTVRHRDAGKSGSPAVGIVGQAFLDSIRMEAAVSDLASDVRVSARFVYLEPTTHTPEATP